MAESVAVMGSSVRPHLAPRLVLLVDDDLGVRETLALVLRHRGYEVVDCANGQVALEYLRTARKPDLIVLDLMMPVMDGWRFRVEQKRDPALASIPVLALSADPTPKAAAIDAEAYLTKPTDPDTICAAVDRLMLLVDHRELDARLAQADRLSSLGTLAAGIAHEINNPLAFVLLNVGLLEDDLPRLLAMGGDTTLRAKQEEQVHEAIAHIRVGAERIRAIVQGLRTFSRPDVEKRVELDLRLVLEGTIDMVKNQIRHRAKLTKSFAPDLPAVVGNEATLSQVFLNLLLNAVQALPPSDPGQQEVRVIVRSDDRLVVVEVQDTGVGIPPEIQGRIFEPFFTTKPVGMGMGLGLAISHGIVSGHGGRISVESEPGKGTCVRVELPVRSQVPAARSRFPSSAPEERRARILIVDDEPNVCAVLGRLLEQDHDVETSTRPRDVPARIGAGARFDLIVCDVMMEEMDGPALYQAVRALAPDQAERMVFVTGGAFTERAQEFLRQVPNPRIEKPFAVKDILRLLRVPKEPR